MAPKQMWDIHNENLVLMGGQYSLTSHQSQLLAHFPKTGCICAWRIIQRIWWHCGRGSTRTWMKAGRVFIPEKIWEEIGKETSVSGLTIPSTFGHRTPNIWTQKHQFTAEDWSFWMVHLAPHVLKGHFNRKKYYKHFMKWNAILKRTIQYSFTEQNLVKLEVDIITYVKEYEV